MTVYTFWNNKGGTGKTTLCFQTILSYATEHPDHRILAIDLCPQANLSELLFGGMLGGGPQNLDSLYQTTPRCSIGGYFDNRFVSPFQPVDINAYLYISNPNKFNSNVPSNVDLIAGDRLVELQSSYMSSLSSSNNPTLRAYSKILSWLSDLLNEISDKYDIAFIDTNPSFSIYTQVAIAATNRLIIPVMADDSSKRALSNVLTLVYGIQLPPIYADYTFYNEMKSSNIHLPQIHMIIKNRLTQYMMGAASAYQSVLQSIDSLVAQLQSQNETYFTDHFCVQEVADFGTTGVVAHAEATSFEQLLKTRRVHTIDGKDTLLDKSYITKYRDAMSEIVAHL